MNRILLGLVLATGAIVVIGGCALWNEADEVSPANDKNMEAVFEEPEEGEEFEEWTTDEEEMSVDSPFDSTNSNSIIGIGGGASGKFAGRMMIRSRSERYASDVAPGFRRTADDPMITFAADVDTGSYTNVRRMLLREGRRPPAEAVRAEEFVNYFRYRGVDPIGEHPIGASIEIASCPWEPAHRLAIATVRTAPIAAAARQPANLVFLIDVSGSMRGAAKLPLLQRSFRLLVDELEGRDRVAIVVYAGAAGQVLSSTACSDKDVILDAITSLEAGGSTAGEAGIRLAYDIAQAHFVPDGINRVLLATDGDFNVGVADLDALVELVTEEAKSGVFLTTLGFGTGNLKEDTLEQLADRGNGHYAYVDSLQEARKVLVEELGATLDVVAKDVKLQASFDPTRVAGHRLVGYANRRLEHKDFADDKKDGGELGAGHCVTALFEIIPAGLPVPADDAQPLAQDVDIVPFEGDALMRLDVRYKQPGGTESQLVEFLGVDGGDTLQTASEDFGFAASVAWFAQALRGDDAPEDSLWTDIESLAGSSIGADEGGYRAGFLALVAAAREAR